MATKRFTLAVATFVLLVWMWSGSLAESAEPKGETPAPGLEAVEEMWQESATPGPEHEILKHMVGQWIDDSTVRLTMYLAMPGAAEMKVMEITYTRK